MTRRRQDVCLTGLKKWSTSSEKDVAIPRAILVKIHKWLAENSVGN